MNWHKSKQDGYKVLIGIEQASKTLYDICAANLHLANKGAYWPDSVRLHNHKSEYP